ncbi:hypothetical protein tinsulaeT_38520 [Thalassotalea insulae]|uniref:Solute-binding protein family 3/N-terminal domain-containing protein n=1 Tax=Thalassotalea insulae TaxID=2056778 RepID=A0ABQ6GYV5_9GAMM|nr:transporter substrate-binding domain-containing protein [Thalassotalea insulae]GLX80512.1 hypothetical protein tinsulaeT_38520 [Thalassotalea insulae]
MRAKLCAFLLLFSITSLANEPDYIVRMGTEIEWAPYHLSTDKGSDGLSVRAFACIMARINQPFTISKLPWKRAQVMTKTGELDGFFSASHSKQRDQYAVQSKVFLPQRRSLYLLKSQLNQPVNTYTADYVKQHLTTGARQGSNALNSLRKHGFQINITTRDTAALLKVLLHHRIDAILENGLVFLQTIEQSGHTQEEFLEIPLEEHPMGAYFSKAFLAKHPTFLQDFNQQVNACTLLQQEQNFASVNISSKKNEH